LEAVELLQSQLARATERTLAEIGKKRVTSSEDLASIDRLWNEHRRILQRFTRGNTSHDADQGALESKLRLGIERLWRASESAEQRLEPQPDPAAI
jgi:hypothetical protein